MDIDYRMLRFHNISNISSVDNGVKSKHKQLATGFLSLQTMSDHDRAKDKAARLLRKQGSVSSLSSSDVLHVNRQYKHG